MPKERKDEKGSSVCPFPFGRQTILDNLKNGHGEFKATCLENKSTGGKKVSPFEFDYERHDAGLIGV